MHSLLLGNGINRAAMQKEWVQILQELAYEFQADDLLLQLETKPLSMFIEELCARQNIRFNQAEHAVKVSFAKLLKQIEPIEAHRRVCEPFEVIMTTNYDFTIEEAFVGPLHSPEFTAPESRYSLFRRHRAGSRYIWHVHGDVARPSSMVLGYDHYAGSLQKIRNYVTGMISVKKIPYQVSSPVKNGILDFTAHRNVYSWVDFFLRDHIHIVGLGMDFTEIDLWWLLLHKRRRAHQTGRVFYYHISVSGAPTETAVTSLLRSLGVEVVTIVGKKYVDCYLRVADSIEQRIAQLPNLLQIASNCNETQDFPCIATERQPKQAKLRFPKSRPMSKL
ncbi:SIR2 family protein (plasmid) [Pseudomonas luteola]|uniref:SIR2 family protein n=1 Tax=Pseudomonas luteola TaxID=47886 RepID=UPI003DA08A41